MTFEEEFPGLKGKGFNITSFIPVDKENFIIGEINAVYEQTLEVESVELASLMKPSINIPKVFLDEFIQEHCLDKQRVRKAIEELEEEQCYGFPELKEKLGL